MCRTRPFACVRSTPSPDIRRRSQVPCIAARTDDGQPQEQTQIAGADQGPRAAAHGRKLKWVRGERGGGCGTGLGILHRPAVSLVRAGPEKAPARIGPAAPAEVAGVQVVAAKGSTASAGAVRQPVTHGTGIPHVCRGISGRIGVQRTLCAGARWGAERGIAPSVPHTCHGTG